jgi:hypothetical protein
MPITFERNDGQFAAEVLFVSRGLRGTLALRAGELAVTSKPGGLSGDALRVKLAGANPAPEVEPRTLLASKSHHYNGSRRVENVPHYAELEVKDVYPGIDMVLHGREGALEYDLVVAPHADPRDIRLDMRGAELVALDEAGNLRVTRGGETLVQHAPIAYQGEGAARRPVQARFELVEGDEGLEARMVVASYDTSAALTIDPVLGYSSYVGGSGNDGAALVGVDSGGDVYYALGASGSSDTVVVSRLDPATNTLVYQTSITGHPFVSGSGIALSGQTAYLVGTTSALDFPVVPPKANTSNDAFVAVIAPSGALTNTRLIGGSASDFGSGIAIGPDGFVHVAGTTQGNLPVTTGGPLNDGAIIAPFPFTPPPPGLMFSDSFAAKLDPATLSTVYLRYVGGSGNDSAGGIAVDGTGSAYVVGTSSFAGFTQVNPGTPFTSNPVGSQSRGFVVKLSPDGSSYLFAEYVGGSGTPSANVVAYDPSTTGAVIGGTTFANTVVPPSSRPFGGLSEAWVIRLDAAGNSTWSSYVGGSASENLGAIAVDRVGTIFVAGTSSSVNAFPTVDPLPGMSAAPLSTNAFVARFTAGTMDFATLLGGSANDTGNSLAIAGDGSLWVGGFTNSPDFPAVNALRSTRDGLSDGYIAQIPGVAAPSGLPVGPPGGPPGLGGGGPPGLGGNLPPGQGGPPRGRGR